MKKEKTIKTKTQKAITLVALIITIIVLLILAVVSINAVTGDGIIAKAKEAKTEYEKAQENEQALMDTYLEYLNNEMKIDSGSEENGSSTFVSITPADYGKSIEYTAGGVSDWKVFYKDDDYLYLITSDYLENSKLPDGLKMSKDGKFCVYWASENDFTASKASDSITKEIANKYMLSWFNDTTKDSTNNNAKATADLLNTTAWTAKFGDSSKGIEAIGGSTLEMWVASWNAKGYTKLYTALNENGYYVGTNQNPIKCSESLSNDENGYDDKLYFPVQSTSGWSYTLASPGSYSSYSVCYVGMWGYLGEHATSDIAHIIRPLVSVPKSLITTNSSGNLAVAQ